MRHFNPEYEQWLYYRELRIARLEKQYHSFLKHIDPHSSGMIVLQERIDNLKKEIPKRDS